MPVPDTDTFNMKNVCDEIGLAYDGATLSLCFSQANASGFDPLYEGSKDRLLNFRNYDHNPTDAYSLGYSSTSGSAACTDYTTSPSTYYLDSFATGLNDASNIWTNSAKTILAPAGWYANGGIWREYDSPGFPGSAGTCGGFSPSYYVYLRSGSTASNACSGTGGFYYIDDNSFINATKIATDVNGFNPPTDQWYSDAKNSKDSNSGVLSNTTSCV